MVDASILDFLLTILTLFYAAIFHLCLQEMRNFPSIAITKTREIQIANYVRIFTIIVSGLTLAYGLMMFGHSIGLGGLETLKDSKINLFFVALGLVAIGSFFGSRIIDQKIYIDVARYEDVLDLSLIELKQKIRKEGKIKSFAKSRAVELEKAIQLDNERLEKETKAQFEFSRKADSLTKEKESKQKSLKNARALKNQTKKQIEETKEKIKEDGVLLDILNEENKQLDADLEDVKRKHLEIDKILQPLIKTKTRKQKELTLSKKEYQNCIDTINQTRKEIEEISSKIEDILKETGENIVKSINYALDHENVLQDLNLKQNQLSALLQENRKYESIIEEHNIAELSVEKQIEVNELLKKRTDVHFNQKQDGDDKIFEN